MAATILRTGSFLGTLEKIHSSLYRVDGAQLGARLTVRDGVVSVLAPLLSGWARVSGYTDVGLICDKVVPLGALIEEVASNGRPWALAELNDSLPRPPTRDWRPLVALTLEQVHAYCAVMRSRVEHEAVVARDQGAGNQVLRVARNAMEGPAALLHWRDNLYVPVPGPAAFGTVFLDLEEHPARIYDKGRWLCLQAENVELLLKADAGGWVLTPTGD